jgi:transcriptional regulator with XRE-family HTH domain
MQARCPRGLREVLAEVYATTGLNQNALAALAGLSPSILSRAVNGQSRPSAETLTALSLAITRKYPALTDLAAEVSAVDDRPAIVRDNWDDPNIRRFWDLTVSVAQRLGYVERYLANQEADAEGHELGARAVDG